MKRLIVFLSIGLMFFACSNDKKAKEQAQALLDSMDVEDNVDSKAEEEKISQILQQIPAPLELSVLIKEAGSDYSKSMLNNPERVSQYSSSFSQALNLGIYGTDLGYTNIYEQNQDALFYLNSVQELAEELSIGQFFDFSTIKRLATNSSNLDSLLFITTKNFNDINQYLQKQRRSNLSALLLTGGWLEALHILCEVAEQNPDNAKLRETVGEQKIIMGNVVQLLEFFNENDKDINQLLISLKPLHDAFSKIQIIETKGETTFEIVDGVMMIKDNSTTEIKITKENLQEIKELTNSVRENIIN